MGPTIRPSEQKTPAASDRVYADLRARIIRFDLPPGDTLGRNELAQTYAVSQTPVREALQRLAGDGLVLIYPQSRTVVSRIDVQQLYETQFLRVSVETEVARRLAHAPQPEVIKRVQAIVQMQRALAVAEEEMDMFAELDLSFHRTLFEAVGVAALHEMLTNRLGHLYRCQRLELPQVGKMGSIVAAHQDVIDAIAAGDENAASDAMRRHLTGTISRIESLRDAFPDYFTDGDFQLRPLRT